MLVQIKNRIIFNIIGILFFFISGLFWGIYLTNSRSIAISEKDIKIEQLRGDPIFHKELMSSADTFSFKTIAAGPGEIKTTLSKDIIPEAAKWRHMNNSIVVNFYTIYNKEISMMGSVSYYHRFNRFLLGGGVMLGRDSFGMTAGFGFLF